MLTDFLLEATLVGAEWVLYLLLALSVISVTIMVERAFAFRGAMSPRLLPDITPMLARKEISAVREVVAPLRSVAARALTAALAADGGREAAELRIRSFLAAEGLRMERGLAFLGTVGANAPFLGLFGTVLGIIRAFHDLSVQTAGGVSTVMRGISEALVATAVGLFVAIPAVVAFNVYQRKVAAVLAEAESASQQLLSSMTAIEAGHGEEK